MTTLTMLANNGNSLNHYPREKSMDSVELLTGKQQLNHANKKTASLSSGNGNALSSNSSSSSSSPSSSTNSSTASLHRRRSSSSNPGSISRSQYALVLVLTPLNGTFEKKSLIVPFLPQVLKLGRQTNPKTIPTSENGYFDSRVLSRQHAEIWADTTGKLWIKDAKSSNGTYINNERLSSDNTESLPHELKKNDVLELGIDISNDDGTALLHRKISAKVERISMMSLMASNNNNGSINSNNSQHQPQPNGNITFRNNPKKTNNGNVNGFGTSKPDSLDVALFGDVDASLEDLVMNHARNSLGGMFATSGLTSSAFESTVKKLIGEIHAAKVEGAKIKTVSKLLDQIKKSQSKTAVLTTLTDKLQQANDQLAEKDSYIESLQQQLKQQEEHSETEKKLQQTLSELAEAKCQLDIYASRAQAAEDMAMKSSKTIAELVQALEDSKRDHSEDGSTDNSSNNRAASQATAATTPASSSSTSSNTATNDKSLITKTQTKTGTKIGTSPTSVVPITAIGVVLIGFGVMSLINARD